MRGVTVVLVSFKPPESPDWNYVVDNVLPRLGMWTGRATFERAVCFIEGFDLATGSGMTPKLTAWTRARYGDTNIGWPWVLIRLTLDTPRTDLDGRDLGSLSPHEDKAALDLLAEALREVVASQ